MGAAASMVARAKSTTAIQTPALEKQKKRKEKPATTTPLSLCIEREQWSMITTMLSLDPTALYAPSSDKRLPLQKAIRKKAPVKILKLLVKACAQIKIPRVAKDDDDDDDDDDVKKLESIPIEASTTTTPDHILPTIDTDPITFQHGRHKVGLIQLIMTMVSTEAVTRKLVEIVLDIRRKEEIQRISMIDQKNIKIIKRNKKIKKKKKKKHLYDTTPRNPLLSEIAAHNNTPLHIAVIRSFTPEFQHFLLSVDNHGFNLSLTDESRFSCAALTRSSKGRVPLHIACRGPFHGRLKVLRPFTILEQLLQHAPEAAQIPTKLGGRLPLHLVLRARANKSIVS